MKRTILIYVLLLVLFSISAQEIKIISGNPALFKQVKAYYLTFDYTSLKVGKYGDEQAYIVYMKDDAEKRKIGSSESWLKKWNQDRVDFYQPKFLELFNINMSYKNVKGDTMLNSQKYILNLHTKFIEPGFNRNAKRAPALIDVIVTISEINDPGKNLVISMTGVPGVEVMGSYYPDYRRIAEAYAKCGKELAKYLSKEIY
jgi:hypothetical protein